MDVQLRRGWVVLSTLLLVPVAACRFDSSSVSKVVVDDAGQWEPQWAPLSPRRKASLAPNDAGRQPLDTGAAPTPRVEAPARTSGDRDAAMDEDDAGIGQKTDAGTGACPQAGKAEPETCNLRDDDCDDKIDELCQCSVEQRLNCYEGDAARLGVGVCRAGVLRCDDGLLGACEGAVLPSAELCNGLDDDCNGVVDDGFALDEDDQNCGVCGNVCATGQHCCSGRCVDTAGTDVRNCGSCGAVCTGGAVPGCCAGKCVDFSTDQTCGACDNACGLLKLGGGFLCTCKLTDNGPACVAEMGMDEWMICR